MFGKAKHVPESSPAEAVAKLAIEALAGTLVMDIPSGIKLTKIYAKYKSNPAQRNDAIHHMVDLMVAENFDIAEKLCDALVAKIGK